MLAPSGYLHPSSIFDPAISSTRAPSLLLDAPTQSPKLATLLQSRSSDWETFAQKPKPLLEYRTLQANKVDSSEVKSWAEHQHLQENGIQIQTQTSTDHLRARASESPPGEDQGFFENEAGMGVSHISSVDGHDQSEVSSLPTQPSSSPFGNPLAHSASASLVLLNRSICPDVMFNDDNQHGSSECLFKLSPEMDTASNPAASRYRRSFAERCAGEHSTSVATAYLSIHLLCADSLAGPNTPANTWRDVLNQVREMWEACDSAGHNERKQSTCLLLFAGKSSLIEHTRRHVLIPRLTSAGVLSISLLSDSVCLEITNPKFSSKADLAKSLIAEGSPMIPEKFQPEKVAALAARV